VADFAPLLPPLLALPPELAPLAAAGPGLSVEEQADAKARPSGTPMGSIHFAKRFNKRDVVSNSAIMSRLVPLSAANPSQSECRRK
jgi:hypothetical protein